MNVGSVYIDAVLIAGLALIVSVASLILTYRENRRMADANVQMAETNREMLIENRRMSDANVEMVEVARRSQAASERAAQVAEEEAQRQAHERTESKKAQFVFEAGRRTGESIQGHLENTGKHYADVSKADIYWGERKIGDGELKRVKPDERLSLAFRFPPDMAAMPDDRFATIRLSYTDGNGSHEKEWTIRFSGGNRPLDWQIEVMAQPEF